MWFTLWWGCGTDPCGATQLDEQSARATVRGDDWEADGANWSLAGSSLQLGTSEADGLRLSLVGQTDMTGRDLETALDEGGRIEVDLESDGFGVVYEGSTSYASNSGGGGGELRVVAWDDREVAACFDFTATSRDGDEIAVEGGAIRALLDG